MLLEGLQLPLTTPFYPDGRLNLHKLEHNVAAYSKTPVAGIAVLSAHGEHTMLFDDEARQVLQAAIAAAAPEKVMLASVSRDSVRETLALVEHAASLAYDVALIAPPSFLQSENARKRKQLLTYFQTVADRSALPVVLSSTTPIDAEVVIELASHPRILGLVDGNVAPERIAHLRQATASIQHTAPVTSIFAAVTRRMQAQQERSAILSAESIAGGGSAVLTVAPSVPTLKTRTKVTSFQILAGSTATMLDALHAGAVGAMPAFAACAPQATYEVFAAWKDGDRGLAEEKQERLLAAARFLEEEIGVAAIKFGCDLNGYFGGLPRLPLLPPSGEDRTQIEALLHGLRN